MSDGWLSNTYLVAGEAGGDAFFVDAGGPVEPLIAKADEHDLNVTHILLTHHHGDHVAELDQLKQRWPDAAGPRSTPTSATRSPAPPATCSPTRSSRSAG